MYMIEPHDKAFTSIPRSIYWCIVTLTTVGYGDVVPTTTFGQIMASIIMILGYGIIAVPTGIVTSEYTRMREKYSIHKKCPHCGEDHLPKDAIFCHKCGEKLSLHTEK